MQLPSGSWRAQVTLQGRRLSHTCKSQQGAREWIRKVAGQIEQGLTYDAERTRVGTWLESWLKNKRAQLRTATIQQYEWVAEKYLLPELGRIRLRELTPARIQAYYDSLLREGRGERTIQCVHIVLYGCLEQAARIGLVARNPAAVCILPKTSRGEMQVWTENQVSEFLIFVSGQRNEILYQTALATGMRRGELLGLKWQDVDWLARTVTVRRQAFHPQGGGWVMQEPKTERGRRSVQLGAGMVERLREQMAKVELTRKIARDRWQEHDLIFPSTQGTPQGGTSISHEFQALVTRSGLPRLRFHDLRHTAATIMLSHGIPPVIVAGMLGHSLGVLMERYAHFIPSMQGEAARLMDEVTSPVKVSRG